MQDQEIEMIRMFILLVKVFFATFLRIRKFPFGHGPRTNDSECPYMRAAERGLGAQSHHAADW